MSVHSKIATTMTRDVVFLKPTDSLRDANLVMESQGYRHIPIVEDDRLVAVLSDRDVLLMAKPNEKGGGEVPDITIAEAMTKHPITCSEGTSVADAATVMIDRKIDSLPVVDANRKLVGLVTATDLLRLLKEKDSGIGAEVLPFRFNTVHYHEYAAAAAAR